MVPPFVERGKAESRPCSLPSRVNIRKGIKGMKKYISFVLLIGLILSLTACNTENSSGMMDPPTSQLSLYIPYIYTLQYEEALEMFEQRYPDVEVTITRQEDQNYETAREEYIQILKNEVMGGERPGFDSVYR